MHPPYTQASGMTHDITVEKLTDGVSGNILPGANLD